ncbi:MAG: molybdenum cofactor guanylyltransferase [Bryobacterales bacterium]|nr:molybdenum cofactor guanylyltransferase [Bryobacterales bacterium]
MTWAGFVLAGGHSTRMGRDKAGLAFRGQPLALWVARQVEASAGNVTLVGGEHRDWGIPVLPDAAAGIGPLGGLVAALRSTTAAWNLILACDMPGINVPLLQELMAFSEQMGKSAVVPVHPGGRLEPLCAAYHRGVLPVAEQALANREFSMQKLLSKLDLTLWPITREADFINANTPAEWAAAGGDLG